jgi:hypothetical protein
MPRAALFGFLGAIVGAAVYYAVLAITGWEIALVAILIGYIVGWSVRRGARGHGGRRLQLMAAGLTYFAVGLAYVPIAFKGAVDSEKVSADSLAADSTRPSPLPPPVSPSVPAATDTAPPISAVKPDATPARNMGMLLGFGAFIMLVFALPVMAIMNSLPSGLISALIIGFGMFQAWQMTARTAAEVTGPYKVGAGPLPAST